MGSLGRVLEALFVRPDNARPTVRATAVETVDREALDEALDFGAASVRNRNELLKQLRADGRERRGVSAEFVAAQQALHEAYEAEPRPEPDGPPAPDGASTFRFWFERPARSRVEQMWEVNGGSEHVVTVISDFTRWPMVRDDTFDLVGRRPLRFCGHASATDLARMFWPPQVREIVAALEFDEIGIDAIAGREVLSLRARLRGGSSLWPHVFPYADEYLLAFDLEEGDLLAFDGRWRDYSMWAAEVTDIAYGETFDDFLFVIPTT